MNEKMPEDCVKSFMEYIVEAERIEPSLFSPIFPQIFSLTQNLVLKKDYDDEKIRELAFELVLSLVEADEPLFVKKKKTTEYLYKYLEMIFNYALEFDKDDQSWTTPRGNNYDANADDVTDDKIFFATSLFDKVISCTGTEYCEDAVKLLLKNFFENSEDHQTIGFFMLMTYSSFEEEFEKFQDKMNILYKGCTSPQPRLRFSAVHCLNKFCDYFNPNFQKDTIKTTIPFLEKMIQSETILRIQCEIISSITSFIQFTTSDDLKPYMTELFNLLFVLFKQPNIPLIIRKLVLECILEIISTMEKDITPLANQAFNIIVSYFSQAYKSKSGQILYGALIEIITSLGLYTKENYYKIIPDIVDCIVKIVKGFDNDSFEPIKADLTNSLDRLLPVLQENFKNLLPSLIETVLTLIKMRPQMSISSTPSQKFDINKILNDKDDDDEHEEGKEIKTSETEDLATSLALLNTIIDSVGEGFNEYVDKVENEIMQLLEYKADSKVRRKSAKILPTLIKGIKDNNVKIEKGKFYIITLVKVIEKETDDYVCLKFFIRLREVIENSGQIFNKVELNELYNKIAKFFEDLKIKRNKLISKKNNKKKKHKDDDSDDENLNDLLDEDIDNLENIEEEIADIMGILLKTHKQIADEIINRIIKEIIPTYFNSQDMFDVKMSLSISDDLIEYIGQDMLGNDTWNFMCQIITKLVTNNDARIRRAASYGIGNFAKFTSNNFDNYAEGLLNALYNAMNIKDSENNNNTNNNKKEENEEEEEEENDYGLAFDNMVVALGKIINYQSSSKIVQSSLSDIITKWIMNLPIKYDEEEQKEQHGWLVDIFLNKRELIPQNCFMHYFAVLTKIYNTKSSDDNINQKIKNIFNEFVKKEDFLKQVVDSLYNDPKTDLIIKSKLEKLIA